MIRTAKLAPTTAIAMGLVSILGRAASGAATDVDPRPELLELMKQGDVPGLAAAVLVDGEIVWIDALGTADFASDRPMSTDTILNIGSVSKLVTSSAVLRLHELDKIDLDADINDYLPFEVVHPSGQGPITVRQLLTHTSGIQDGEAYAQSYACGDPEVPLEAWLRGYLVPGGAYYAPDNFLQDPPGTDFEYSNVGYGLLGLIAETVSETPFSELTRELVFDPLGMESSGWFLADVDAERLAIPYWINAPDSEPDVEEKALMQEGSFAGGRFTPFCLYGFYNYPDGLVRTTIADLARFVAATIPGPTSAKPLLSPETRQEVFKDQIPGLRTDGREQGLGWRRTESKTLGVVWGHGGADPGIRAHVLHRPDDRVTVIVMSNALVVEEFRPILKLLFSEGACHRNRAAK